MAGILDNKSRVLDAYITQEGRRQLAQGELRIKYVTFSDSDVYYTHDAVEGAADVTNRIYLEPSNLPQDQIVFEADDSGKLRPFKALSDLSLAAGQLSLSGETFAGSTFSSVMKEVLASSIDNFEKLRIIGSYDTLFGEKGFSVGPEKLGFVFTDIGPITDPANFKCRVNDTPSLFNDARLSQVENFSYLPPVNRIPLGSDTAPQVGNYPPWSKPLDRAEAFDKLFAELAVFEEHGYMRRLLFDPTSVENNLVGQVFEVGNSVASKLDVIHFGKHVVDRTMVDVFFAGKVVLDDNDTQSFIHIFTMVFE